MKILNLSCFKNGKPSLPQDKEEKTEFVRLYNLLDNLNQQKVCLFLLTVNAGGYRRLLWLYRATKSQQLQDVALGRLSAADFPEKVWRKIVILNDLKLKKIAIQKLAQLAVANISSTDPEITGEIKKTIDRPEVVAIEVKPDESVLTTKQNFLSRFPAAIRVFFSKRKQEQV